MEKKISVGIADMKITRQEGILITYALGSCIGVSFYDPMIKLGALLHIMLPEKGKASDSNVFKFADSGVKETLRKLFRSFEVTACSKDCRGRQDVRDEGRRRPG